MSPSDEQIRAAIAEQASEWFMENRGGPLDQKESARFMIWLQASPMHVEEYLRIAALAPDLEAAAKTNKTPRETLLVRARGEPDGILSFERTGLRQLPALARRRRSPGWSLAAAATLAVVAVTTVWSMRDGERFGLPKSYSTVRGEQRIQTLPDGSVLHLNTDSAVTVRYSRTERFVSLDRGQALLEVAHQDGRRLRVQTDRAGIVAGRNAVRRLSLKSWRDDGHRCRGICRGLRRPACAAAGQWRALGASESGRSARRSAIQSERCVTSMRALRSPRLQRQIAFEDEPLGEVAAEFNRYGPVTVEIDEESLRALPISSIVDAYRCRLLRYTSRGN